MRVGVLELVLCGGPEWFRFGAEPLRFRPIGIFPTALPSSVTRSAGSARLTREPGGSIATPAHGTRGSLPAACAHPRTSAFNAPLQTTVSSAPTHICIRPRLPALQTHPTVRRAFQIPAPAHSVTPAASIAPIAAIKAAAAATLRQASADMIACEAAPESAGAGGARQSQSVSPHHRLPPSPRISRPAAACRPWSQSRWDSDRVSSVLVHVAASRASPSSGPAPVWRG